jgi:hypothetical protein
MAAVSATAKVAASDALPKETRQELARVLTGAFMERDEKYPIRFEDVWRFLGYSSKGNALRKLKDQFLESEDYSFEKGLLTQDLLGKLQGKTPDSYCLTTGAFEHFCMTAPGVRGKLVRQFFLGLKSEYFRTLEGLSKRRRQDIMDESRDFLDREQVTLAQELKPPSSGLEKEVQLRLQNEEGGVIEVSCEYGRVDLLTEREVVEVKAIGAWKHALGQALAYSGCFPKHKPRVHLFVSELDDSVDVSSICKVCEKFGVRVTIAA